MVAWTNVGPRGLRAILVALMLGAGVVACATSPASDEAQHAEAGENVLTDVWVEREGDSSLITLVGLEDASYTAFMHEDPATLVIDLSGTDLQAPSEPMAVYDGLIEQVSVSGFDGAGADGAARVEVSLAETADYDVIPTPTGLAVRISRMGEGDAMGFEGEMPASIDEGADPWSDPELSPVDESEEMPLVLEAPAELPAPDPATALDGIEVSATEAGVLLHLLADGVIDATESFTLEGPDRLVLDLPGLANRAPQSTIEVGLPHVERVRVGGHPEKVRVVIDGGEASAGFEGRRVMPSADGLFVTLGTGADLDDALAMGLSEAGQVETEIAIEETIEETPMADEEPMVVAELEDGSETTIDGFDLEEASDVEETTAASDVVEIEDTTHAGALATVHGVHFDSQPERDRVVVLSEGIVDYETYFPDPETVVVSIMAAQIPREAEGRITPQPGGPVSLITAFQQPEVQVPEVRVVMKRAADLAPEISRRGEILFVDFPNTGLAAAAPPAFPGTSAVASTGGAISVADEVAMTVGGEEPMEGDVAGLDLGTEDGMENPFVDPEIAEAAQLDGVAETEIAALPEFSETTLLDGEAAPAAIAPAGDAGPASLEPPAAVEMLQEGGLIDGKEYSGRRISLDFKDVEIADVLRIIAEVSDLNIVAGEEVEGQVTIRLVDVPWDQALDVILLTKGLGFVRVGNVLRIAPAEILAQEEEVRLQERRNKEKLEDLVVKLHPVNYADVNDVSDLVKRLLSARGTVNIDERTNTLIMKDIASVIDEATALVNAIDTQTPQVMIEAKIVEANLDFSRELGSLWSIGTNPLEDGFDPSSDPRRDLGGEDFRFHDQNNVIFANPITSLASGLGTLNAFILDEKLNLNVSLAAAESSGDGKVISSPRIVTLDNREAEIAQGVSIPFQTFENGDAKLEFIDAVLRLMVTPHITADKSIIMKLEVERNAPDDSVQTPTGSPAIAKNEAKTETLVKDGQTLVIGGIYTVVRSQRESRVPYLHMIPFIGNAFKSREVTDQRKELLIFVTPRVVLQPNAA